MPKMIPDEVKAEAIRLRVEDRLGIREIRDRTGLSIGTLSVLLKDIPLSSEEVYEKMSESALRSNPNRKYKPRISKQRLVVERQELTTAAKGHIAEAAVILRMVRLGYEVWKPVFEGSRIDFAVSRPNGGKFIRLQVKWARRANVGRPFFTCRNGEHGKERLLSREYCDFAVGYDLESDTAFVVPIDLCEGLKTKSCDEEYAEAWHLLGI